MSELPVDEWVWAENVVLACGCRKSSWVRTSDPGRTAEDVMNRWGAMMSVPGHRGEHVELCREHVGDDPPAVDWLDDSDPRSYLEQEGC